MPKLTAIAAVARNGVIGDGDGLLWHIPEDFARFKAVTMGGALVMGRRTYQSLGRPLPGRTSIVLTRNTAW
ncbi:MAG: dihydrofolate reductase, partial [Propionibacteriaceae bacterium]|nr:dihydrofolate reductase [Propionibacteriaceae bacterium]